MAGAEYGLLIYDIPSDEPRLAARIPKAVRKHALRVNLSCYLFPWRDEAAVRAAIAEAEEDLEEACEAYVIPQGETSVQDLLDLAQASAQKGVENLMRSMVSRASGMAEFIKEKIADGELAADGAEEYELRRRRSILRNFLERKAEIEAVCIALRISGRVKGVFAAAEKAAEAERECVKKLAEAAGARCRTATA